MLLSNFTIYLIMKYGRTIQILMILKNHDHAYLKFINIFLKNINKLEITDLLKFQNNITKSRMNIEIAKKSII